MKRQIAVFLAAGILGLWGVSSAVPLAGKLQPFTADSLQAIEHSREGRPFFIVFWALDCPPCRKELELLGRLHRQAATLPLVLISTDDPGLAEEVAAVLEKYSLADADNWIFADTYTERLRYVIDPQWYGELPRSYFYDGDHNRRAVSGILKEPELKDWLRETK